VTLEVVPITKKVLRLTSRPKTHVKAMAAIACTKAEVNSSSGELVSVCLLCVWIALFLSVGPIEPYTLHAPKRAIIFPQVSESICLMLYKVDSKT